MCFGGQQTAAPVNPAPYAVDDSWQQVTDTTSTSPTPAASNVKAPSVQPTSTADSFNGPSATGLVAPGSM